MAHPPAWTACRCSAAGAAESAQRLFNGLVAIPGLYDGLHFAHLRTGSRLADLMDRAATARLVPALRAELDRQPADLVISVFATGASAAAKLKAEAPGLRTVVLCTDVAVHRMWVAEGTDLFLVTSTAAAAVGPALPAAGAGRGRAAAGAVRLLRCPVAGAGQGRARGPAGRLLRAGHRQRLGIRPAGGERVRARRRRRARAGGGRPGPHDGAAVPGAGAPGRRGSRRSASPTGFPS